MPDAREPVRSTPPGPLPLESLSRATDADAEQIARLRTATAEDLTARFGTGHWSSATTTKGVRHSIATSLVAVARDGSGEVIATLSLQTKKPWAIDTSYFTPCGRPLYLTAMAVRPNLQRRGIGRRCLEEAARLAMEWPADALRLDAYDAAAGAGPFYARCGYVERGRVTYRGNPLIYFELMLPPIAHDASLAPSPRPRSRAPHRPR